MRNGFLKLALALACAAFVTLSGSVRAQTQAPPPADAFGALPQTEDVSISPDGTKIALTRNDAGVTAIMVLNIADSARVFAARIPDRTQLRGIWWLDNERVAFRLSETMSEISITENTASFRGHPSRIDIFRVGVANITTGRMKILATDEQHMWANDDYVQAPIEGDPGYGRMVGWSSPYSPALRQIFRINLDTSQARVVPIAGVNSDTKDILVDNRGQTVARVDIDDQTNHWSVFGYVGNSPRLLLQGVSQSGDTEIDPVGLFPDQRLALRDTRGDSDQLIAIDRATGAQQVVNASSGDVINDPVTGQVVGVSFFYNSERQTFFDPALQQMAHVLEQLSPNGEARLLSWSSDRSRAIVYVERGLDGGGYYLMQDGRLSRIAMRYPRVADAHLGGERQAITYPARDGTRIPAFLTLPSGPRRNLPLVLLVHGGPESRDELGFDWWAAFLASRGYAVLQPNYRGSSGYGRAWARAGYHQWGRLMQTDVEDGVAALIRAGMADASRICVVGASYGGYAALAGATLTPDRYRCAVSVAGVSDLERMLGAEAAWSGDKSRTTDYWRMSIGDREEDRAGIRAVSPVNLADRVRAPILLIHGTDDTVVPIVQSRMMEERLRAAGKSVRFVTLQKDDHWLSDASTRTQMLTEIESFLAQNIGPQAPH